MVNRFQIGPITLVLACISVNRLREWEIKRIRVDKVDFFALTLFLSQLLQNEILKLTTDEIIERQEAE